MIRDLRMKRQGKKWTDNNGRNPKNRRSDKLFIFI